MYKKKTIDGFFLLQTVTSSLSFSEFPVPAEGRTFDVAQPLLFHLLDCICKVTLKSGTSKVVPEFSHGGLPFGWPQTSRWQKESENDVWGHDESDYRTNIYTLSPD